MSGTHTSVTKATVEDTNDESLPQVPPKNRASSPVELLREEPLHSGMPSTVANSTNPSTLSSTAPIRDEDHPPAQPPRPVSQFDQHVLTLTEAFPAIDLAVVKAVLTASGGKLEPAFNALLGMSDPDFVAEEVPPPQPPRPTGPVAGYNPQPVYNGEQSPAHQTSTPMTQLEADELYARQLAEHYGAASEGRRVRAERGDYSQRSGGPGQRHPVEQSSSGAKERSFIDDDLPEIGENIKKGFFETQSKVSKWVVDFKKRLDGDDLDVSSNQNASGVNRPSSMGTRGGRVETQQAYPQRQSSRRSGDNYDADPRVLEDDFSHLELRNNTGEGLDQPRQSGRPLANPNLFDSNTVGTSPAPRRVSFQDQDDDELYRAPISTSRQNTSVNPPAMKTQSPVTTTAPTSKWAPLAAVEPTPLNNDPFSLGDSDDEHEAVVPPTTGKTGPQESGVIGGIPPLPPTTATEKL